MSSDANRPNPLIEPTAALPPSRTAGAESEPERDRSLRHDLAVAVDGSFVETTSEAAAKSMAKFYSAQEGEGGVKLEYAVQTRTDQHGNVIYRIRPLSQPSTGAESPMVQTKTSSSSQGTLPFAQPAIQPPLPASDSANPTLMLQRSSARVPPPLRLEAQGSSQTRGSDQDHSMLSPVFPARQLRKAGSTPALRDRVAGGTHQLSSSASASRLDGTIRSNRFASTEADVLGRILGWRDQVADGNAPTRRVPRSARVELPESFKESSQLQTVAEPELQNDRHSDTTDLPRDLVDELGDQSGDTTLSLAQIGRSHSASLPFGSGVRIPRHHKSFSPLSVSLIDTTPLMTVPDRTMREVASNDSIRTARPDRPHSALATPKPLVSVGNLPRFQDPAIFDVFHRTSTPTAESLPSSPTALGHHARFPSTASIVSTSSSNHSRTTTQPITVQSVPGDDPRFAIWGAKEGSTPSTPLSPPLSKRRQSNARPPTSPPLAMDLRRGSIADADFHPSPATSASGSPATTSSRRWSISGRGGGGSVQGRDSGSGYASPATSVRNSVGSNQVEGSRASAEAPRILLAATVERLVSELTSKISVELLSDFFLTFRHYLAPLDLLHLLITRFEWAMAPTNSIEDDALRRVVRVRTFVVLRFWLLNHFMDDFYPSKEMRSGLTDWLNASAKDPKFRANPKDARLIKNLKKTVRKCKETFVLTRPGGGALNASESPTATTPLVETSRRASEEDVDLDLVNQNLRTAKLLSPTTSSFTKYGLRSRKNSAAASLPTSHSTGSISSEPAFPLPGTSQNPISKSFASALGTLGRFKRMLGHRASYAGTQDNEQAQDDFERSETGDLLWVQGGLEKYLEYWNIKTETESSQEEADPAAAIEVLVTNTDETAIPLVQEPTQSNTSSIEFPMRKKPEIEIVTAKSAKPPSTEYKFPAKAPAPASPLLPIFDPDSYASDPAVAFAGRPASTRIELDDLDDSDDDDDDVVEVKKTLKRLPNAYNLRFAATVGEGPRSPESFRGSFTSESSYGFGHALESRLSYGGQERESVLFVDDEEGGEIGVTVIPNFILEGLLDSEDEDEPGDVEAALRRLEGLVDTNKEEEKAKKVARQMQKSEKLEQERKKQDEPLSDSDPSNQSPVPEQDGPTPATINAERPAREAAVVEPASVVDLPSISSEPVVVPFSSEISTPVSAVSSSLNPVQMIAPKNHALAPPNSVSPASGYPTIAGRKATLSRIFGGAIANQSRLTPNQQPVHPSPAPPTHRSFLLFCRTETLAQQFTLIERDMLRMLSYQELVSGSWKNRIGETDVLDWELYIKERRKEDLMTREKGGQVMSAVQDVITRFNLMANWVCSEILLTANIDERAILIGKFIRLAFKCYCHSNFQTVMQIVHGLQIPHVERLRKTWAKVPSWEIRKLEGMQRFTSHLKNFGHLRDLMNRLAAEYSPGAERLSLSDPIAGLALKGCIPFAGLFLRDLALNTELPTFIDPSSTNSPACVDHAGSLTSIANPHAFDSLPNLPDGVALAPLVNLHKFRRLATIVQRIRTFQALSERYAFEPTQPVYFKCLKIRALNQTVMHELSSRIEP
ncbi:mitotic regulator LTE1 [Sporobolomyces koalae]|uniref:mitotic regulator LTE1 n=1 Tax=Sporobolomyces koalae TaxID=500713 RepID=UPI00317F3AF4